MKLEQSNLARSAKAIGALAAVIGLVGHVHAQSPGTPAAEGEIDFSGMYVGGARPAFESQVYPFTAEGERRHNAYDPLAGDPRQYDECAEQSVPNLLWAGTVSNMRVVQRDATLELRYEHGGAVRSIHMDGRPPAADQAPTPLGYSVGRWDGEVLTIETTHLAGGFVSNNRGYPLSPQTRLIERYSRGADNNLNMDLVIEDPVNYTEPFELGREWNWSPDEKAVPWNCVSLGDWEGEPDFDELRRILRQQ